jgi:hypothetical protein
MGGLRGAVAIAAVALLLVGCAAAHEIPLDRASAGTIKTIGVVTPSFPDKSAVVLASSVGQSFGLIGALVDAGMRANREAKFDELMKQQNFSAQEIFLQDLRSGLEANGYVVTMIPLKRDKAEFETHYPNDDGTKVDAYLDLVTIGCGYVAAGIGSSTPYRPVFIVRARLVRAKDSSVLMQDVVAYNPVNAGPNVRAITIPPDPAYSFTDFDTLVADPTKAAKGLQTAIEQSTQTVSTLLK